MIPVEREQRFWFYVNTFPGFSGITVHDPGIGVHDEPESFPTHCFFNPFGILCPGVSGYEDPRVVGDSSGFKIG